MENNTRIYTPYPYNEDGVPRKDWVEFNIKVHMDDKLMNVVHLQEQILEAIAQRMDNIGITPDNEEVSVTEVEITLKDVKLHAEGN